MIDRVNGPVIHQDFEIDAPLFKHYQIANDWDIYEFNSDSQEIVKIDLCFRAGRIYERKRAVARACLNMMKEATLTYSADQLSERFDFYGSEYYVSLDLDSCRLSLLCLEKHLKEVFPLWTEIIFNPRFDDDDFEKYKSLSAQKLRLQLSKNEVIAYRKFTEEIFGSDHPYGYNTYPEDILSITTEDLRVFYNENIGVDNSAFFISGRISESNRAFICSILQEYRKNSANRELDLSPDELVPKTYKIQEGNGHQVSVKVGGKLFPREHIDFSGVYVLNTILGGYFGSRLMSNVREDKGLSYNIYSVIESMLSDGFWYVAADVANENVDLTLSEIKKEIQILQTELIADEELQMVKNYLQGYLLSLLDGPFASSKVLQGAWKYNLDFNYIGDFAKKVQRIDNYELRALAVKYFDLEQTIEVQVGSSLKL